MKYTLPELPYKYDALEPWIDARTMEIHHDKHHAAYVNKLNEALAKHSEVAGRPLEELLGKLDAVPEDIKKAVQNHGGGHWNHSFFWRIMMPKGGGEPGGELAERIRDAWGDFAKFKEDFTKIALDRFGSGWAWLTLTKDGVLKVDSTPNQDCPISNGEKPILGLDIWEHAYYLRYQNRRQEYIEAWWNVVNWAEVEKNLGSN